MTPDILYRPEAKISHIIDWLVWSGVALRT